MIYARRVAVYKSATAVLGGQAAFKVPRTLRFIHCEKCCTPLIATAEPISDLLEGQSFEVEGDSYPKGGRGSAIAV